MLKQETIGSKRVYTAEFGTGDIAIIPAATPPAPGRPGTADNMLWLVQDEPKPEEEWDNDPLAGISDTDALRSEPMPIVLRFGNCASLSIFIKQCTAMYDEMQLDELKIKKRMAALLETKTIMESGFAGTMPNGNIVDRRDYPQAMEIKANKLLGIPEALPLPPPSTKGGVL